MTCKGKGAVFNSVKETINIPKGVDNGVNLRVSKKGHFSPVGPPGDLMVQIKVKPHPYFKRDGSDIQTDLYISVS
jgi:molecular chaperone DnaJ